MFCRRCYRNKGYYRNNQQNEISFNELKDKVSKGAILIDVRSPQEYNEGHLQGAVNVPDFELINRIQKEIPKKNQLIIIYCQYGGRSRNAYMIMKRLGYTNIYNLYGGLDMI